MSEAAALDLTTWLSDAETCARLGISPATLDREVKRGHLHPLHRPRPGNRPQRCFDPDEVQSRMAPPPVRALTPVQPVSSVGPQEMTLREPSRADETERMLARALDLLVEARKPPKPWATLDEAAGELGLTRGFLYRLVRSGALDAVRDRRIKVRREDLEDLDVSAELVKPVKKRRDRS